MIIVTFFRWVLLSYFVEMHYNFHVKDELKVIAIIIIIIIIIIITILIIKIRIIVIITITKH